jgi:hypothetical protein
MHRIESLADITHSSDRNIPFSVFYFASKPEKYSVDRVMAVKYRQPSEATPHYIDLFIDRAFCNSIDPSTRFDLFLVDRFNRTSFG